MSMGKKNKTIEFSEFPMNFPLEFPTWILKKSPWGDKYTNVLIFGWFGGTPISGNLNIYIFTYIDIHLDIHIDMNMEQEQEQEQDRSFIEYIII